MEEKSIELEGTRARLRQLEKSSSEPRSVPEKPEPSKPGAPEKSPYSRAEGQPRSPPPPAEPKPDKPNLPRSALAEKSEPWRRTSEGNLKPDLDLQGRITSENYVKYPSSDLRRSPEEPKVTFDLGPKKAKLTELPAAKRVVTPSALPSDARQRLQELAGQDIRRNYRKTGEPIRPSRLNVGNGGKYIVSPPVSPARTQSPATPPAAPAPATAVPTSENLQKRTSLTRKDSRSSQQLHSAKNSLIMNFQNNNVKKASRESLVAPHGNRTRTPSVERSFTNKDDKDLSKVRGKSFWGGWWKFS